MSAAIGQASVRTAKVGPAAGVPQRVGRYDLVARVGGGGMATVWLARTTSDEGRISLAAIKLMHPHLGCDPDFVRMFLDEARLAAGVQHPNVVGIHELAAEQAALFTVMDYIAGDSLAAVQATAVALKRAIPSRIVMRVMIDALRGLHAAHEACDEQGRPLELVHRDVSPQNILIGVDGMARLTDFGIARAQGRLAFTLPGMLKGKLPFMAPEHIEGKTLDRRADVYAAAVTLWENLALRRLFPHRASFEEARRTVHTTVYRPVAPYAPEAPAGIDAVIARGLATDLDDRFATAAEFADALTAIAGDQIASAEEVGRFMGAVARTKLEREYVALREAGVPGFVADTSSPLTEEEITRTLVGVGEAAPAKCHTDSGVRPTAQAMAFRAPTLPAVGPAPSAVRAPTIPSTGAPTGIAVIPTGDEDALADAPAVWITDDPSVVEAIAPKPVAAPTDPHLFDAPEPTRPISWRPLQPAPVVTQTPWVRDAATAFGFAAAVSFAVAMLIQALV
jgi:serine/threonine-protein kinase